MQQTRSEEMNAGDEPEKAGGGGGGGDEVDKTAVLGALTVRLEEILSKQNLADDSFIQQHMNAQLYVPANILATHHRISILEGGADVLSLLAAARLSDKLAVDEDGLMVRPVIKPRRNTLILHDLPEGISEDDLRELLVPSPEGLALVSIKPDVNHTAYASFKSDEAAQTTALWLRTQKLQGAEIKCAVKSEHFVRSFFPATMPPKGKGYSQWGPPQSPWMGPGAAQWQEQQQQHPDGSAGVGYWGRKGGWDGAEGKGGAKGKGTAFHGEGGLPPMSAEQQSHLDIDQDPHGGDEEEDQNHYAHDFRKYNRQRVIELCNAMEEITKPESYKKLEKEDVGLFRQSPSTDWAPPLTPQIFPRSFEGVRNGDDHRVRTSSSWSRGSRTTSGESEDLEPWGVFSGGANWRSSGPRDKRGWSWDEASSAWDASPLQREGNRWIEKGSSEKEADTWRRGDVEEEPEAPRKMSWVEKVKGSSADWTSETEPPQKWKPKSKVEEGGGDGAVATQAAREEGEGVAAAAVDSKDVPAAAAPAPEVQQASGGGGGQSWAERMRKSSGASGQK